MNFSKANKATPTLAHATGSADRNGTTIDLQGFHGVAFAVHFGAVAGSATVIKAQGGHLADMSDAVDLAGTAQSVVDADDDKVFIVDIANARHRYVRLLVDKDGANSTTESAVAYLYNADKVPVVQPSDALAEFHHAPAAGTA